MSKFGGDAKKCAICAKTVYPQERVDGLDSNIHQSCFYCPYEGCKMKLSKNNYGAYEGVYYCQNHFKAIAVHSNPLDKKIVTEPAPLVNAIQRKDTWKVDVEKLLEV
jgi:hypothetical protein